MSFEIEFEEVRPQPRSRVRPVVAAVLALAGAIWLLHVVLSTSLVVR